jgi:hypothetical protein
VSRRRRILLAAVAALALLVALAPMLARTGVARRLVAGRLSAALGRPVEIAGLDAGWTSGVRLEGLVVRNATAEFRGEPLLEARSVRIETALPSLVLSGADAITVDGLRVRLEEQGGGRTNIDDFLSGLAQPRPRKPVAKPKPFRFQLKDASIEVRTLLRRPQPRPVDPFREDPVIRDAGEGLLVLGVDRMDLDLDATPKGLALDLSAALRVAGKEGRAEASLRLGPDGPSGRLDLTSLDLSALRPFVPDLAGRIDVHVEGSPKGVDVLLRANDLKAGRVEEAWVDLKGRIREKGEGFAVDALSLRTASDAYSLDAKGAWPPKGITIRARAATGPLGLRIAGPLVLDATGEGSDLEGTLTAPDVDARFDLGFGEGWIVVRKLDAKAFSSSASLQGALGKGVRLEGRADVSLEDLAPLLPEGASLEGHLAVARLVLEDRTLKADATVEGLRAHGLFDEDLNLDHGEVHVDATLSSDRDTLTVAHAQLDGLAAEGTIGGLAGRDGLRADGRVRGTLALNPLHARLLGLKEVRGLRGQLAVDVTASTERGGLEASGTATIRDFHVSTDQGAWDLASVSLAGGYLDGKGKVEGAADGATFSASLEGGKGTVALDVEAIERHPLAAALLPKALTLRGPVSLRAELDLSPMGVRGTLDSKGLTAKVGERGIAKEPLHVSFAAQREEERGWSFAAPEIALPGLGAKASVSDGGLGTDGTLTAHVRLEGPIDRLARALPEARDLAPKGTLALDATVARDGRWSFQGTVNVRDASLLVGGTRAPETTALLDLSTLLEDDTLTVRRFRLKTRTTDVLGAGAVGKAVTLRAEGKTRLEEIGPYAPLFRGSGELLVDEVALDLSPEGAFSVATSCRSDALRIEHSRLTSVALHARAEGRLANGALEDMRLDLESTMSKVQREDILVEGVHLHEKGGGRSGAYDLGTRIDAGSITIGATSWDTVGLDVRGRLDRLLGERPPSGVLGTITFARWHLGPFLWEDAKGKVAMEDGNLVVKDLVAGLSGGRVRADGRLVPTGDRLAWEGTAKAEGIVLSEEIGRPLSFIIPFLRVKKQAGTLSGRADFDLSLAADDTTDVAILRTLAGKGAAHLYDIEAKNSILLPLLSLRLDKAILQQPYRFKDLKVAFDVGKGKIRPEPFELRATPFGINVKEIEVGLDGTVDALIVPGILPFRISGTLDDPKVRPAPLAPFR